RGAGTRARAWPGGRSQRWVRRITVISLHLDFDGAGGVRAGGVPDGARDDEVAGAITVRREVRMRTRDIPIAGGAVAPIPGPRVDAAVGLGGGIGGGDGLRRMVVVRPGDGVGEASARLDARHHRRG